MADGSARTREQGIEREQGGGRWVRKGREREKRKKVEAVGETERQNDQL